MPLRSSTPTMRRWALRYLSKAHLAAYRLSRGRVLGSVAGMPVLAAHHDRSAVGQGAHNAADVLSGRDRPRGDRIERRCRPTARLVAQPAADPARGRRDRDRQGGCLGQGGVGAGAPTAVGCNHGHLRRLRPLSGTDNATDPPGASHTRAIRTPTAALGCGFLRRRVRRSRPPEPGPALGCGGG